jgi:DNA-binding Xre family transcriptional regulator
MWLILSRKLIHVNQPQAVLTSHKRGWDAHPGQVLYAVQSLSLTLQAAYSLQKTDSDAGQLPCRVEHLYLTAGQKSSIIAGVQNKSSAQVFVMSEIETRGRLTALLGRRQMTTGERVSLRRLADLAEVPKDLVYRLDAGDARYVDLEALARLCQTLDCQPQEILVWNHGQ